jgi:hypothetical protein
MKVLPPTDPSFARVARLVVPPPRDHARSIEFFGAFYTFSIGSGSTVDVSYYYGDGASTRREVDGFDRHFFTEELFIAKKGDILYPAAPCRNPDDPGDLPHPEDFNCYHIREGEWFIQKPNTWHDGLWPVDPNADIEVIVILSGHRKELGAAAPVDHMVQRFPEGQAIYYETPLQIPSRENA